MQSISEQSRLGQPSWVYMARDEAGGVLQQQEEVAEESESTAKRRQRSGNDDRARMRTMLDEFNREIIEPWRKERDAEKTRKAGAVTDVMAQVLRQARKEEKQKKASDAIARQKAYDAAVEADALADQRKQERIAAADHNFYGSVRRKLEGRDDKEIGEVSASAGQPFASQVKSERAAQEKLALQPPKRNGVRYASAYEDLGSDYSRAGRALRGEDAAPRNHDEKFDLEWRLARRKLEGK